MLVRLTRRCGQVDNTKAEDVREQHTKNHARIVGLIDLSCNKRSFCMDLNTRKLNIPLIAPECGRVTKRHDLIWHHT